MSADLWEDLVPLYLRQLRERGEGDRADQLVAALAELADERNLNATQDDQGEQS